MCARSIVRRIFVLLGHLLCTQPVLKWLMPRGRPQRRQHSSQCSRRAIMRVCLLIFRPPVDYHVIATILLDVGALAAFFANAVGEELIRRLHRLLGAAVRAVPLLVDGGAFFGAPLEPCPRQFVEIMKFHFPSTLAMAARKSHRLSRSSASLAASSNSS